MTLPTLQELWDSHTGRLIDRWQHYLPIYERYFAKWREKPVRILEIGVSHGGSLQLWKAYFGPYAEITGLDVDPRCKDYWEQQITIWIEDQSDFDKMEFFAKSRGPWDIIIDDGSHLTTAQEVSFAALWQSLSLDGIYLVEDCHSMYPAINPQDGEILMMAEWVMIWQRKFIPKRIVTGRPSRPLNADEVAAYGAIDAKYQGVTCK